MAATEFPKAILTLPAGVAGFRVLLSHEKWNFYGTSLVTRGGLFSTVKSEFGSGAWAAPLHRPRAPHPESLYPDLCPANRAVASVASTPTMESCPGSPRSGWGARPSCGV